MFTWSVPELTAPMVGLTVSNGSTYDGEGGADPFRVPSGEGGSAGGDEEDAEGDG